MDTTNDTFRWPDSPPYPTSDWFQLTGAELGLEPDQIKFAAALITLGGPDSKNNTVAARTAGMDLNRVQAFRLARSVKIRKLIDNAEQIKQGKRKPLSEEEIDARVDKMCMSPNDRDAATGIKLRDDRKAARLRADEQEESLEQQLASVITSVPESGCGAFLAMSTFRSKTGNLINYPFLAETLPIVARYFPGEWQLWRPAEKAHWVTDFLDKMAAGPFLEGDQLKAAIRNKSPKPVAKQVESDNAT